jgi:hypothetical protein
VALNVKICWFFRLMAYINIDSYHIGILGDFFRSSDRILKCDYRDPGELSV